MGTTAGYMVLDITDTDMEVLMPTHFLRISTEDSPEEDHLTPIHGAMMSAHWAGIGNLPKGTIMDICTPVDERTRKPMHEHEFAHGELPIVNVGVNNLETMPEILYYTYHKVPAKLLEQLIIGDSQIMLWHVETAGSQSVFCDLPLNQCDTKHMVNST
jgi:hypothetical protein